MPDIHSVEARQFACRVRRRLSLEVSALPGAQEKGGLTQARPNKTVGLRLEVYADTNLQEPPILYASADRTGKFRNAASVLRVGRIIVIQGAEIGV